MRRTTKRRLLNLLLVLMILGLVLALIGGAVAYFYCKPRYELAHSFDLEEIDDLEVASIIFDRDGGELGRIFLENRQPISIDEIPAHMVDALVATEDARFFDHDGVDYIGVVRAAKTNFQAGRVTQGASTITQQLARNAFDLKVRGIERKVVEAFLAQRIERRFKKRQILELYLNRIYFGSGFYGISAAANGYFGKEAKNLSTAECAVLAGLIKSPNRLSPFNSPEESKNTRNYVFVRMEAEGFITEAERVRLAAEPLVTAPRGSVNNKSKYVYEQVRQQVIELIGYERANEGGFQIFTTIDSGVQQVAEKSLQNHLDRIEQQPGYSHQTREEYKLVKKQWQETKPEATEDGEAPRPPKPKYLQGAVLMIDNKTGGVRALVGGRDFSDSMYDRALLGRRQTGSAFMPFVYAAAFQKGLYPGSPVDDLPIDAKFVQIGGTAGILGEWATENHSNVHEGQITARRALAQSKVAATVRFGLQAGLSSVIDLAESAGISFRGEIKNFNAAMLGRSDNSMKEFCLAYTIFPNGGTRPQEVHIISKIVDIGGNIIHQGSTAQTSEQVIDEYSAFQVTSCLEDALHKGTGARATEEYGLGNYPAAGKTGTEYGYTDNWFVGFTSEVTCAVWAGLDQPATIYKHAFSSDTVLPVWSEVMNAAAQLYPPRDFAAPAGADQVEICKVSGQLATDACYIAVPGGGKDGATQQVRSTYVEFLRPGTVVRDYCHVHGDGLPPGGRSPGIFDPSSSSLTGHGPIRAQVAHAEPILPTATNIVGIDPYNSIRPTLRARVIPVLKAQQSEDEGASKEGEDGENADDPEAVPRPRAVPVAVPVAVPLTGAVEDGNATEATIAVPIATPVALDPNADPNADRDANDPFVEKPEKRVIIPERRVTLPLPEPIRIE
jgi:penicillin-binding protein 1A